MSGLTRWKLARLFSGSTRVKQGGPSPGPKAKSSEKGDIVEEMPRDSPDTLPGIMSAYAKKFEEFVGKEASRAVESLKPTGEKIFGTEQEFRGEPTDQKPELDNENQGHATEAFNISKDSQDENEPGFTIVETVEEHVEGAAKNGAAMNEARKKKFQQEKSKQ